MKRGARTRRTVQQHTRDVAKIPHFCPRAVQSGGACGGCALGHLPPAAQDMFKAGVVEDAFHRAGIETPFAFHPADERLRYRNRTNYVPCTRDGRLRLGSFAPGTHIVAPMDGCAIVRPPIDAVAKEIARRIPHTVPVLPDKDGLRHVTVRSGGDGGALVDLVLHRHDPHLLATLRDTLADISPVRGVSWSVNPTSGNAIRVAPSVCILGEETIDEHVGHLRIPLRASDFFQLHTGMATSIYARAASADTTEASIVWDLYCGSGGLGLTVAARRGCQLRGADFAPTAIDNAKITASRAGIDAHFEVCDLSRTVPLHWPAPHGVIVNPPRRGLDSPVLQWLCAHPVPWLLYMSCHPDSFAKDASVLIRHGYRLAQLDAFDMLPHTPHVELLGRFAGP